MDPEPILMIMFTSLKHLIPILIDRYFMDIVNVVKSSGFRGNFTELTYHQLAFAGKNSASKATKKVRKGKTVKREVDGNAEDVGSVEQLEKFWSKFKTNDEEAETTHTSELQMVCYHAGAGDIPVPATPCVAHVEHHEHHDIPSPKMATPATNLPQSDDFENFLKSRLGQLQGLMPEADFKCGPCDSGTGQHGGKSAKSIAASMNFPRQYLDMLLSDKSGNMTLDELATWIEDSSHSSSFSGIGAPETALLLLHKEVQELLPHREVLESH